MTAKGKASKPGKSRKERRAAKALAARLGGVLAPRGQPRNTDVYLTWPFGPAAGVELTRVPCRCPHDRAHAVMVNGHLAPAKTVAHARPRMYPPGLLNSAGLSIDSQADAAFEAQCRAARGGYADEERALPGVSPIALETARRLERLEQKHGRAAVRALTRTFGALKPEPGDGAGDAWLARHAGRKGSDQ